MKRLIIALLIFAVLVFCYWVVRRPGQGPLITEDGTTVMLNDEAAAGSTGQEYITEDGTTVTVN